MRIIGLPHDKKRPESVELEGDGLFVPEPKDAEAILTKLEVLLGVGDLKMTIQCPKRLNGDLKNQRKGTYFIVSDGNKENPNMLASACFNFDEIVFGNAYVVSMDAGKDGLYTEFNRSPEDMDNALWQINGYADIIMLLEKTRDYD